MGKTAEWWVALQRGDLSPRQLWALLLVLGIHYSIVAFNHTLYVFQAFSPPVGCQVDRVFLPGCQESCPGEYVFPSAASPGETIVTEWSLVCSRRALRPAMATLYFLGVAVGALVGGALADMWGRRLIMLVCLVGQAILGVAVSVAPSLTVFAVLRTAQGFFVQGLQGSTFTLLVELFPSRLRTAVGVVLEIYWAGGLAVLALLSYVFPDWRDLQLAVALPASAAMIYMWWVPESRLWLASRGHQPPFKRGLPGQGSYMKKKEDNDSPIDGDAKVEDDAVPQRPPRQSGLHNVRQLFLGDGLRVYTAVMVGVWFAVSMSYYGTTFHLPALTGNRHLNFAVGALMELVAYCVAYVVLSRLGRRLPLAVYLAVSALACLIVSAILASTEGNGGMSVLVLVLSSKAALVSSFCTMFLYTAELFPTGIRAAAMGLCGFSGRVGNLLAPLLLHMGLDGMEWFPLLFMGVLLILITGSTLLLPETLGRELPATVQDAKGLRLGHQGPHVEAGQADDPELEHLTEITLPVDTPKHQCTQSVQVDTEHNTPDESSKEEISQLQTNITAVELENILLEPQKKNLEEKKPYLETNFEETPETEDHHDKYKTTISSVV